MLRIGEIEILRLQPTALLLLTLASLTVSAAPVQPSPSPENTLVYEIFVRSFADTNGDGIGDLNGITARLDSYLNDGRPETDHDLEIGVLWLMPVYRSTSYHGYDVTDFRAIAPAYGTLDDFKRLLTEAHRRGVRVILDGVFNHTARDHPWFTSALNDAGSRHRTYYHIAADDGQEARFWHRASPVSGPPIRYFGLFSRNMPDLSFDNQDVRAEVKAIAKFWLDLGVDGFRLDAAKHVYGDHFGEMTSEEISHNNAWWREFSRFVYSHRRDAILVGEVLGDRETARRHAWGLDGLLHDGFMDDVRGQLARPAPGLLAAYKAFETGARELNRAAPDPSVPSSGRQFHVYPFIGSHDRNPRLASELEGVERRGGPGVDPLFRMALYLLLGGASHPVWYAGDEMMQRGWKWRGNAPTHPEEPGDGSGIYDETLREPIPWTARGIGEGQTTWFAPRYDAAGDGVSKEEQDRPGGMLHLFRGLTNLRTRHPVLANGEIGAVLDDSAQWIAFERVRGSARYVLLVNRTQTGRDYRFHEGWFPQYVGSQLVFWSDGGSRAWADVTDENRRIDRSAFVPPFGLVVLRAR